MISYDPSLPIISLHVPKSGGRSLGVVLSGWFGRNLHSHYYNEKHAQMPTRVNLYHPVFRWRYKHNFCIHGHFNHTRGFGVNDYYPEINQFFTILRDPFDIFVSNYFHSKRVRPKFAAEVEASRDNPEVETIDINSLLATGDSFLLRVLPEEINADNYQEIIESRFVFVGIMEQYQQSLDLLAQRLGKPSVEVPVSNVSNYDETILNEQQARAAYRERHPLEYAIYDYAVERLQSMLA